jgi:hypothetical protein
LSIASDIPELTTKTKARIPAIIRFINQEIIMSVKSVIAALLLSFALPIRKTFNG